jgi:hypothetical protein
MPEEPAPIRDLESHRLVRDEFQAETMYNPNCHGLHSIYAWLANISTILPHVLEHMRNEDWPAEAIIAACDLAFPDGDFYIADVWEGDEFGEPGRLSRESDGRRTFRLADVYDTQTGRSALDLLDGEALLPSDCHFLTGEPIPVPPDIDEPAGSDTGS